jgi:hypothetical protein
VGLKVPVAVELAETVLVGDAVAVAVEVPEVALGVIVGLAVGVAVFVKSGV